MDHASGFQSTPSNSEGKQDLGLDGFERNTVAGPCRDPDALPRHNYNLRARTKPRTTGNTFVSRHCKQGTVTKRKIAGRRKAPRRAEVSAKNLQTTAPGRLRYLLRSRIKNGEQLELLRLADNTRPCRTRKVIESRPKRLGTNSLRVDADDENACETAISSDQEMVSRQSIPNPCNEQIALRTTNGNNKEGSCAQTEHDKSYLDEPGERRSEHRHQTLRASCTAEKDSPRDVSEVSRHPEAVTAERSTGTAVSAQNRVLHSDAVPDKGDQVGENVEHGRIHSKKALPRRTSPSATALYEDASYRSGHGLSGITPFTTQAVPSCVSPRRARLNCGNENIDLDVARESAAHRPSPRKVHRSRKRGRALSDDEQVVPPKPPKLARKDDTDLHKLSKTSSQLDPARLTVKFPSKRPRSRVQRSGPSNVAEGEECLPVAEPENQMFVTAAASSTVRSDNIATGTIDIEDNLASDHLSARPQVGGPSAHQATVPLLCTHGSKKNGVSPHGADRSSNCSTQNSHQVAPKGNVDRRSDEEQGSHKFPNIQMPQTAQDAESGCFSAAAAARNEPDYDLPREPGVADARYPNIAAYSRDYPTKGDHQQSAVDLQDRGGPCASALPGSNTPSSSRDTLPANPDDMLLPELVLPPNVRIPLWDMTSAHDTVRLKASQEFTGKEADQIGSSSILQGTSNLRAGAAPTQFSLSSPFLARPTNVATKDRAEVADVRHQTSNCRWLFSSEYQPDLVIPSPFKPPDDTDWDLSCPSNNHKVNGDDLKHTSETTTSSPSHDEQIARRKRKPHIGSDHGHDKHVKIALDFRTDLGPADCWAQLKQQLKQQSRWTSRALDDLMLLPGIEEVKSEFLDILQRAYHQDASPSPSLDERHAIFLGNPGTGMATVAQIYATFLEEQGRLCRPYHMRIVSASTLRHAGAEGLKRDLDRNDSRHVILVEDAHQLATHETATIMPILATLCSEMRRPESRVVWIFAGRQAPLLAMLDSYPHMRDVFGSWFYFADLSERHVQALLLQRIREQSAQEIQFEGGDDGPIVQHVARLICQDRGQAGFGNGDVVESVVSQILMTQKHRLEREQATLGGSVVRSASEVALLTREDMLGPDDPPHRETFSTHPSTTERRGCLAGRTLQVRGQSTAKSPNGAGELGHIIKVTSAPSSPDTACSPLTSVIRRSIELASANGGFYDVANEPPLGRQFPVMRTEKYATNSHTRAKSAPDDQDVHIMSSPVLAVSADLRQALEPTNREQDTAEANTDIAEIIGAHVTSAPNTGHISVETANLQQQAGGQPSLSQNKAANHVAGLVFDRYASSVRPVTMQLAEARSPKSRYALGLQEPSTLKVQPCAICDVDATSSTTQFRSVAAADLLESSHAPRTEAELKDLVLSSTAGSITGSETVASLANDVADEAPAATDTDQMPDDGTISQLQPNVSTAHLDVECFPSATATMKDEESVDAPTFNAKHSKERDCFDKPEPIIVGRTFHGWMQVSATTADRDRRLIKARRVPEGRHCDYFYVPSVRDSRSHAKRMGIRNGFRNLEWVAQNSIYTIIGINLESHGSCRRTAIWITAFRACMGNARAKKELAAWQPQQPCCWGSLPKTTISRA